MSRFGISLSDSLQKQAAELAAREGVSLDHFVATAIAEKVATIRTAEYLEERGRRGSRERLLELLAKAPDVEPDEFDRL